MKVNLYLPKADLSPRDCSKLSNQHLYPCRMLYYLRVFLILYEEKEPLEVKGKICSVTLTSQFIIDDHSRAYPHHIAQ